VETELGGYCGNLAWELVWKLGFWDSMEIKLGDQGGNRA